MALVDTLILKVINMRENDKMIMFYYINKKYIYNIKTNIISNMDKEKKFCQMAQRMKVILSKELNKVMAK